MRVCMCGCCLARNDEPIGISLWAFSCLARSLRVPLLSCRPGAEEEDEETEDEQTKEEEHNAHVDLWSVFRVVKSSS